MKDILITGANGFVGAHLSYYLNNLQLNVYNSYRLAQNSNDLAYGDLNLPFAPNIHFLNALKKCDTIVHLAARVHIMNKNMQSDINKFKQANTDFTVNLAKLAKKNGVKKFIFISTIKVNGESTEANKAFSADDFCSPTDPYAISKHEAEIELLKLHDPNHFSIVIIRPPLIYGPNVKGNFKKLISLVKLKLPLPFLNMNNSRSLVSVYNLCDLIYNCILNSKADGQILLVSDNKDLSLKDILLNIADAYNIHLKLFKFPQFILNCLNIILRKKEYSLRLFGNLQVDITKTQTLLNWNPPFKFKDSLLGTNYLPKGKPNE